MAQPETGSGELATDRSVASPRSGRPSLTTAVRRPGEAVAKIMLRLAAWLTIAITVGIVVALVVPSLEFFAQVPITDFLFGTRWAPRFADASFGVIPLVTATVWTTAIALTVAVPLGLGSAVSALRVRPPPAAFGPEADPGDPGWRPDSRLRSVRAHVRPGHGAPGLVEPADRIVQRAGRRSGDGRDDRAHRRLAE